MNFIISYMERIPKLREYPDGKINLPLIYRLIFQKALGESNAIYYKYNKKTFGSLLGLDNEKKNILKTIWENHGISPSAPYIDFFIGKKNIWKSYEINERGDRSVLSNVERLKMTHSVNKKQLLTISKF